jgi:hypothetical protein
VRLGSHGKRKFLGSLDESETGFSLRDPFASRAVVKHALRVRWALFFSSGQNGVENEAKWEIPGKMDGGNQQRHGFQMTCLPVHFYRFKEN